MFGNPLLDEINGLSPGAKAALTEAHQRIAGQQQQAPGVPAPIGPAGGAPSAIPNGVGMKPIAAPGSMPPPLGNPTLDAHKAELARLTTGDTGKSGIGQIHNPFIRVPLQIADAVGGGLFPGIAMGIPGTQTHHNVLVRQASKAVNQDEAMAGEEAKQGQENAAQAAEFAQANDANARAGEATARTAAIQDPQDEFTSIPTASGYAAVSKKHGTAQPIKGENGEVLQPIEKQVQPHFTAMPDGSVVGIHTDPKTGGMHAEVVFKGDPKTETELTKLEVGGASHSVIVDKKTGQTIKDLGPTGEKTPTVNVNAGTAALDRESGRFAKGWEKASSDAAAQLEKIQEAKAEISGNAISQAVGIPKVMTALVSGQGSGVRITQAELNAIAHARGIQGDFQGFLSKVSGKGQLTTEQKGQLNSLLSDVEQRILQKQRIASDALDTINTGAKREDIIKADQDARHKLSEMERQGGGGGGDMIRVQIPGQPEGQIHASQKEAFLKKFPNAKVF